MLETVSLERFNQFVIKKTFLLAIPCMGVATVLFSWVDALTILIGCGIGLWGFRMIQSMVHSLTDEDSQKQGQKGYMMRYSFYGVCLVACALLHLHVLAVLVGILCHKAALVWYAWKEEK